MNWILGNTDNPEAETVVTLQKQMHTNSGRGKAHNSTMTLRNPRSDLYVKEAWIPRNAGDPRCEIDVMNQKDPKRKSDSELAHRTWTP